ncbi:MAG: hydroxymethylpyrimidine/phosphomethylpyrimidine kinase [Betaproteobacteria bacterium]|nr:hydroxymethylpyrimidine/phosphomethylpyrimidine kinase [Betaproteobacteria bacterium]MBI2961216.1 hydroxymethylpyrimidine/phosphomethylpyrimidine kinase [Betaproteobacteria bacterium]
MNHSRTETPAAVLAFAAADPSGGAGIQADLLTLAALGCHPLSVITAITVQDTSGVQGILAIDSDWVVEQARVILEDVPVAAFKLGLLGSAENIAAIAKLVSEFPHIPLILDPVLASGRGDAMASDAAIAALCELLVPKTTIVTPNSLEARRLARQAGERAEVLELPRCARRLLALGAGHVLITGTHEDTPQVLNTLYGPEGVVRSDAWERLPGSFHGSGCTLASAIAATLANGLELSDAVREAQEYTWQTLAAAFRPGAGQHIPDRFFWAREMTSGGGKA